MSTTASPVAEGQKTERERAIHHIARLMQEADYNCVADLRRQWLPTLQVIDRAFEDYLAPAERLFERTLVGLVEERCVAAVSK